jgi:uncharacterized protein (DUF305 family)
MENKDYNDEDVSFIQMMIPHHQSAVDAALLEYKNGQNAEIKKMAIDIFFSQSSEIQKFKDWLNVRSIKERAEKMKM